MASAGEVWVINKINDLAQRCGIDPVDADVQLSFVDPKDADCYYHIGAMDGGYAADETKVHKFWSLLGLDESGQRRVANLGEVDGIVDRALALIPRSRSADLKGSGHPKR